MPFDEAAVGDVILEPASKDLLVCFLAQVIQDALKTSFGNEEQALLCNRLGLNSTCTGGIEPLTESQNRQARRVLATLRRRVRFELQFVHPLLYEQAKRHGLTP